MTKLSDTDALRKLFGDTENIDGMLQVLNGCCFTINQRLKQLLEAAVSEK